MNYTGLGDSFLDGNGQFDFATEERMTKDFKFVLTNANAADQMVILFPGDNPSVPARVAKTGNIVYTGGAADLSAAGDPHSIEQFIAMILRSPVGVLNMRFETNLTTGAAFTKNITIIEKALGQYDNTKRIKLEKYVNTFANNDKIVIVNEEIQLGASKELQVTVPANSTLTVTLELGLSLSLESALQNKRKQAYADPGVKAAKKLP